MIKYLGSKRRLVPVLDATLRGGGGAHRARPVHRHHTRRAGVQAARRARHRGRHRALLGGVRADATSRPTPTPSTAASSRTPSTHLNALPGEPGYFTDTFCVRSRFFQPSNGARVDAIRDAIERDHAGSPLLPDPADQPDRGRRPGRLDHRRADGVREAVGAAVVPRRSTLRVPELLRGPGRGACAAMRSTSPTHARPVRPRVPRPAVQPAPLLHELPRLGDAGGVGRARALRRRLQADRRARPTRPRACSTNGGRCPRRSAA